MNGFFSNAILRLAGLFVPLRFAILLRLRAGRDVVSRRSSHATRPCTRPATASQAREPDSPPGLPSVATSMWQSAAGTTTRRVDERPQGGPAGVRRETPNKSGDEGGIQRPTIHTGLASRHWRTFIRRQPSPTAST
jgi:hypothetical protein